jgi:hypothetical protein
MVRMICELSIPSLRIFASRSVSIFSCENPGTGLSRHSVSKASVMKRRMIISS